MGEEKHALGFSKLASFSLAFGCIIGWGCFVVPGTTFLPKAGVVGMDHAFFSLVAASCLYFRVLGECLRDCIHGGSWTKVGIIIFMK